MENLLAIALGGAVGALLRYGCTVWVGGMAPRGFPWGTLSVNVVGSFLLGVLAVILAQRVSISPAVKHGVLIGVLGGFTTFSTFSLDTWLLAEEGYGWRAGAYVVASVVTALCAVALGAWLGRQLV